LPFQAGDFFCPAFHWSQQFPVNDLKFISTPTFFRRVHFWTLLYFSACLQTFLQRRKNEIIPVGAIDVGFIPVPANRDEFLKWRWLWTKSK